MSGTEKKRKGCLKPSLILLLILAPILAFQVHRDREEQRNRPPEPPAVTATNEPVAPSVEPPARPAAQAPPKEGTPAYWKARYEELRRDALSSFEPQRAPVQMASGRIVKGVVSNIAQDSKTVTVKTPSGAEAELLNTTLAPRTRVAFFRDDFASMKAQSVLRKEVAAFEAKQEKEIAEAVDTLMAKMIADSFSQWDGSHRNLVKTLKLAMHDPSSFEHVKTRHRVAEDWTVHLEMDFRNKNAFGALVLQRAIAEADALGNILGLKLEGP